MPITFQVEGSHNALNLCNANACDLLRSLDKHADARRGFGFWNPEEQRDILERINKLNSAEFEKETVVNGRVVECGRDAAFATGRLGQMRAMLIDGITRNKNLCFR